MSAFDLLLNLAGSFADDLLNQIAAAAQTKLLGHNAKSAVGSDEIYGLNALVALHRQQEMA